MLTMAIRIFAISLLALAAAMITSPRSLSAQQAGPPNQLLSSMNVPLPAGPFASWPAESRASAVQGVKSRCMFMVGMAMGGYKGPKEAAGQEAAAAMAACITKLMPQDWPEQTTWHEQFVSAAETAKRLNPSAPDPDQLADAIVKAMKH
jgi:hypothetical protein